MGLKQLFGYEGKNVVITGAASGMAKAATKFLLDLGANVYALDLNEVTLPVKQSFKVNMENKDEVDHVLAQLPKKIDAVFICHAIAGWPDKAVQVATIDFVSQRYLAEKILPQIPENGSVTFIASDGGYGWQKEWAKISQLLQTSSWDEAVDWLKQNEEYVEKQQSYAFSKKALVGYVKASVWEPKYIDKKIRINSISPGDTKTGLSDDFANAAEQGAAKAGIKINGTQEIEKYTLSGWNGRVARPEEMAYPLVFLGSNLASYISGQDLNISYGKDAAFDIRALNKEK